MKILIVDDHAVIHQGLRRILGEEFPGATFGEARHFQEATEVVKTEPWNIVIIDMELGGRSGLDLVKHINSQHPTLPILVFSMYAEDQFAVRALRAGAMAYVTKDSPSEELLDAIQKVSRGRKHISPALAEKLANDLGRDPAMNLAEILSDREFEIMRLIAAGHTTTAIGTILGLSIKTVSTYRKRTLEKLRLNTTSELIRYAIEQKISR
jgi:two-component system invasion response regulator UvrY